MDSLKVFSFAKRDTKPIVLRAHGDAVHAVCLVGTKYIWTCSSDRMINVWNAKSQALVTAWEAHRSKILCMLYVQYVSPSKKVECTVWTSSEDMTLSMWHTKEPFVKIQDLQIKVPNPVTAKIDSLVAYIKPSLLQITCLSISSEYVWGGSFEHMQIWTLVIIFIPISNKLNFISHLLRHFLFVSPMHEIATLIRKITKNHIRSSWVVLDQ